MRLRHNMDCGGPDVSFGAAGLQQVSVLQSTHRTEGGFDESSCDDGGEVFSREDRAPEVREQWRALRELFKGSTQREAITSAREAAFAAANAACVEAGVRWSRSPSAAVRRCSLHISRVPVSRALVVGRPSDSKHGHASASSASDSLFKERTCPPSPGRSVSASSRTVLDVSLLQRRSEEIHYAEWPALQRALPRGLSLLEEVSYLPLAAAAAAPSEEAGRASGVSRESLAVPRKISVGQGETPSFDPRRPLNQPQLGRLLKRTTFAVLRRGLPKFFDLSLQPLATFVLHALKQRLEGLLSALRPTEGIGGKALEALVVQVREALTASASSMGRASATEILASHRMAERLSLCSGEWGTPGIEKRAFLEGALEVWALEKLNGENAQISYNAALDCWVVCSKRVSLLLPFGAAPSEARASSSPFAASAEAKASGTAEGQGLSLHSGQEAAQQHRRHFVEGEKDSGDLQAQECRGSSEETKPAPASPRGLSSQVGRGILCDRALHARRVAGAWSSLLKTLDEPQVTEDFGGCRTAPGAKARSSITFAAVRCGQRDLSEAPSGVVACASDRSRSCASRCSGKRSWGSCSTVQRSSTSCALRPSPPRRVASCSTLSFRMTAALSAGPLPRRWLSSVLFGCQLQRCAVYSGRGRLCTYSVCSPDFSSR